MDLKLVQYSIQYKFNILPRFQFLEIDCIQQKLFYDTIKV